MTTSRSDKCRMVCAWMLISIGYFLMAQPARASLTAQTVTGTVDKSQEAILAWEALKVSQPVDPGQVVRTDFGANTDIKGDDGSFVYLDEATQLAIRAFEFKPDQQIRIAKFAIIEGTVTAEAAHLDYATNVFDVETPTVVASFKFSKAKFVVDHQGNTDMTLLSGKFEIRYIGTSTGSARTRYILPKGAETDIPLSAGAAANIETTEDGLKVANTGTAPILLSVGGQRVELSPGASIMISEQQGKPVIKNTSSDEKAEVKVGGVLIEPNGTLTLTGADIQTLNTPIVIDISAEMNDVFSDINCGNTTSSVPSTSGGSETKTEVTTPGTRPGNQTRTVKIPVRTNSE